MLTIGDVIIGVGHGSACYSQDTEILTEDGWKLFTELKRGEKVATLNPETNELIYQSITKRFIFWYKGKMFHQNGRHVDLLVTPNHKLYCSWLSTNAKYRPFNFIKPQDIGNGLGRDATTGRFKSLKSPAGRLKFKRNAQWCGESRDYFILPKSQYRYSNQTGYCGSDEIKPKKVKMDDFLRFFGIWLAEGCTSIGKGKRRRRNGKLADYQSYRVTITQNDTTKREVIRGWLQAVATQIGFKFWQHKNSHSRAFEFRNKQMFEYLKQFGKAKDKYIPKEIKSLPPEQLRILLNAMMLGDGSKKTYSTSSKKLADDVQEIALKAGFAASVHQSPPHHSGYNPDGEMYEIGVCDEAGMEPLCEKNKRSYIDYEGYVYSVEVPRYHTLYVRRNGKPCWSGNSEFCGHNNQVIMDTLSIPDVRNKVIILIACETARELGPKLVEKGAASYIGFKEDLVWVCDSDLAFTPWADKEFAVPVMMPITNCVNAVLDGKTTREAFNVLTEQLACNAEIEEDDLIRSCINFNKKNAVLLGSSEARVVARPKIILPLPPPPIILPVVG